MPATLDPAVGESLCAALREQAARLGVSLGDEPIWAQASLSEAADPYTQAVSVLATWRAARAMARRHFSRRPGVCRIPSAGAAPTRPGCFIDAVQVWGAPARGAAKPC